MFKRLLSLFLVLTLSISFMCIPITAIDTFQSTSANEELVLLNFTAPTFLAQDLSAEIYSFVQSANSIDPEIANANYSITEIKPVFDFAGNLYYIAESEPTGYFIYNPELHTFLEYSYYSTSPYLGYYDNIFYAGAMEYYVYADGTYLNILTNESINAETLTAYIDSCTEYYETLSSAYLELANDDDNLNPYSNNVLATSTETYVRSSGFFKKISTEEELGYYGDAVCGYIAAGLLLLYYDSFLCDNIIRDSAYSLSYDGKAFDGDAFTKKLRSFGTSNSTAATAVGSLTGIDDVINRYIRSETNCSITANTDLLSDINSVAEIIKSTQRPLIVYGSMLRPNNTEVINHAVVAYGCKDTNTHIIVNYGHSGYNQVYLSSLNLKVIGSTYRITNINGTDSVSRFTDLGMHWAHKDINRCVKAGFMDGISSSEFSPSGTVTRGMLVTILYRIAGSPSTSISHPFTDVSSSRYYAKAISWAYNNGIVNGTSSTEFSPDDSVTRSHAIRIIYRFATEYLTLNLTLTNFNQSYYPELSNMSGETFKAWNWAIRAKIIKGVADGNYYYLYPNQNITRAEIATIVNCLLGNAGLW